MYATAVLQRAANGDVSIKRRSEQGPVGLGVGAVAGGLVALLGGPAGVAAAAVAGGLTEEVAHTGLEDELIEAIERDLTPGSSAVVAEVSEESPEAIDARLAALGGKVSRQPRRQFAVGFLEDDLAATRADLTDFSAERAGSKLEAMELKLDFDIETAREKLERTAEKGRARVDRIKQELQAKLEVLGDQAARTRPEVRDRVERHLGELRRDLERREEKLRQAYELASEALR